MMSTWEPLPDKENPAFKPSFKMRASGPVKISNRGAIPKKQVFGDLKNTIQNFKAEGEESEIIKGAKSVSPVLGCHGKPREDDWPEPESLPANLTIEDDFEDCLLPGLKFSKLELEELPDIFRIVKKPLATHVETDSPISLPQGRIHLDHPGSTELRLEFPEEVFYHIQPVWDYDI